MAPVTTPADGSDATGNAAPPPAGALPPLIAGLLQPDAFPHPAQDIRLHETHISWVILAGSFAYKIKKPVYFGFVDFLTPELRAADCETEVRLNRRLCPDVYLGVVDIVERDGRYAVGGPGRVVERAVRMRRLPENGMLTHLLARGEVDAGHVRRVARLLARFHTKAASGSGVDEYGSLSVIRKNWQESFVQVAPLVGLTVGVAEHRTIAAYVDRFLRDQHELLERRIAEGRIREGHGDLHAGSICLEGRRIHLFDCLEFTPRFRCADVAAEVAFLVMDLEHHGRADLAEAFVDTYVKASGDTAVRRLLPFYSCYRAYVRGKVLSLRLAQELVPEERRRLEDQARSYFDLAWTYAGGLEPTLVLVMGLPASGKTMLAHALAGRLGLLHLSSDLVRKKLAGLAPTHHQRVGFQRGLYDSRMTRRTYAMLRRRATRRLRAGGSVVLDATYGQPAERAAVRRLAERLGVPLVVLVCEADDATLRARLLARDEDPGLVSDARLPLWPALRDAYLAPTELASSVVNTAGFSPGDVLEKAVAVLKNHVAHR